ncbi:MAG: hypothetical protein IT374_08015 [Polyangiaceae bacterium]|nr:hypothetical protein [Polyangiaceae bacterium]
MRLRFLTASLAVAGLIGACGGDDAGPAPARAPSSDLPASMQAVLSRRCWDCHGETLRFDALAHLVTRRDLLTKPAGRGGVAAPWPEAATRAQLALHLMRFAEDPMPPAPRELASDDERATWKAWVDAGCPGAADAGPDDVGCDPFDTPVVCTSGATWQLSDPLPEMNPGRNCVGCHSVSGGPPLVVGGTVYPTAHEPDDCRGADGAPGVTVEVTDAAGTLYALPVNRVGNFWLKTSDATGFTPPFSARVRSASGVREMTTQQKDGDCNACHSKLGDNTDKAQTKKAPGRVVLP